MLIANPIYQLVFKYMMENIDVAKGIIATIIDMAGPGWIMFLVLLIRETLRFPDH